MRKAFDFEQALKAVQSGQAVPGKDGVLAPLVKPRTEAALEDAKDSSNMVSESHRILVSD